MEFKCDFQTGRFGREGIKSTKRQRWNRESTPKKDLRFRTGVVSKLANESNVRIKLLSGNVYPCELPTAPTARCVYLRLIASLTRCPARVRSTSKNSTPRHCSVTAAAFCTPEATQVCRIAEQSKKLCAAGSETHRTDGEPGIASANKQPGRPKCRARKGGVLIKQKQSTGAPVGSLKP